MTSRFDMLVFYSCDLCNAIYEAEISECDCDPDARSFTKETYVRVDEEVERLLNL